MGEKPLSHDAGIKKISEKTDIVLTESELDRVYIAYFYDFANEQEGLVGKLMVKDLTANLLKMSGNRYSIIDEQTKEFRLNKIKEKYDGYYDEKTLLDFGKQLQANALIYGTYYEKKQNTYEYEAKVVNIETGQVLGMEKILINKKSIFPNEKTNYNNNNNSYFNKKSRKSVYSMFSIASGKLNISNKNYSFEDLENDADYLGLYYEMQSLVGYGNLGKAFLEPTGIIFGYSSWNYKTENAVNIWSSSLDVILTRAYNFFDIGEYYAGLGVKAENLQAKYNNEGVAVLNFGGLATLGLNIDLINFFSKNTMYKLKIEYNNFLNSNYKSYSYFKYGIGVSL